MPSDYDRAHAAATTEGKPLYRDAKTGLWVMTGTALLARGTCCGSGCRHCPYPPEVQRAAGRPGVE